MDFEAFRALKGKEPPAGLTPALRGLLWEARGEWDKAHGCAQEQDDREGAWLHAYLHRREGDLANAGYWYRRARKPVATGPLDDEWEAIARGLLTG